MSKNILVVAPHPDDETLGCGGTLLKHKASGDSINWLIVTSIIPDEFNQDKTQQRNEEVDLVSKEYGFSSVEKLNLPTTKLDLLGMGFLISQVGSVICKLKPDTIYVPYRNDAHSDHTYVFDAVIASAKSFRYPYIKSVYSYETVSETEFGLKPEDPGFRPNLFVDIEDYIDKKIRIMQFFKGEMQSFPFPRSEECLVSLAKFRGSQSALRAAEAFMIIKEIR